ncbi:GAF and ANTAR domain-containing protein [Nocardia brasiliensis]|uniref:GAF and ANTAR domain-containing protein n=1 Tax=Nocardia brasiliensis TaxID=37326 RepID=UPI00367303F0
MTDDLALGMSELTATLLAGDDVAESLCAVADIVARMLPDHPMVGVTLIREHDTIVVGSSGAPAMVLEESRCSQRDDPCQQAIITARQVSVPDMATEHRWGGYAERMLARGVKSIHAQPLSVKGEIVGALSLYSRHPHSFTGKPRRAIALTAEQIGVLLAVAVDTTRRAELTEQLRAALASRSTIDQALGILMAQRRCTREVAFEVLRGTSQRRNVRVADLAVEIIEAISGGKPPSPHFVDPEQPSRPRRR